jgi:hypothetical protein
VDGVRWPTPMLEWRVFATGNEGSGPVGGAIEGREGRGRELPDMMDIPAATVREVREWAMKAWATRWQAGSVLRSVGPTPPVPCPYVRQTSLLPPSTLESYAGSGYPGLQPVRVAGVSDCGVGVLGTAWTRAASAC